MKAFNLFILRRRESLFQTNLATIPSIFTIYTNSVAKTFCRGIKLEAPSWSQWSAAAASAMSFT